MAWEDEPSHVVQERITTEADGPDTVNERLSTGGPGPEGQPDTVHERLSGDQPESEQVDESAEDEEPAKPVKKASAKKKS